VPDDNKSNRGDRDFENRQSSGRESDFSSSSSNDRERDSKGRFESDDSENESSSSSRSGSHMGSSGNPQKKK
jgi:hypothetical protein